MPQAKPTQVIVHRIELQQSERQMLKEYVEQHERRKWIQTAGAAVQPAILAGGVMGAAYVGIRGYQALVAALNSLDVEAALDELMKPVYPAITATPIIGPIFGKGGFFDFFYDIATGQSMDPEKGNPLYQESDFTYEEVTEEAKKIREDQGVLNSIFYMFGWTPFPKWL
jgi:hypothetical protein